MFRTKSYQDIDVRSAAQDLAGLAVLDVREPAELRDGYIAGATNVPLGDVLRGRIPSTLSREAPVLVVCRSGGRSASAAGALASQGFSKIYNLAGGMMAWQRSGLPTV